MALTRRAFELLAPYMRGVRAFSLGYPDALLTGDEANALFNVKLARRTQFGLPHKFGRECVETVELFCAVGSSLFCVDVNPSRGVEVRCDLNVPTEFAGAPFDLVLDAGTTEHCANIGQAMLNAANAVKVGGVIFHSGPLSMVNHGFYNINPTLLHDFYTQNGWKVLHLSGFVVDPKAGFPEFEVHPTSRSRYPDNAALYFMAQRAGDARLRWPTQTKYLQK